MILRLNDSFASGAKSDVEVTVRMVNINIGHNEELLDKCKTLGDYSWLVSRIRQENVGEGDEGFESAVDRSIDAMPGDFEIKSFLEARKAEARGMLLSEHDVAKEMELFKEEGRAEGAFNICAGLVRDGDLSEAKAAERLGLSVLEFRRLYDAWVPLPAAAIAVAASVYARLPRTSSSPKGEAEKPVRYPRQGREAACACGGESHAAFGCAPRC